MTTKTPVLSRILVVVLAGGAVVVAGAMAAPARAASAPEVAHAPPTTVPPTRAPAAVGSGPDVQARDLFQSQRYADALAIYQRLHAETRHPTYLRNIGRCHQMLRAPAPAIDAFRAYLRDARDMGPAERTEIDGYIAEMQRLEVTAPVVSQASQLSPESAPPVAGTATAAARPDAQPLTRKWWFWTGVGALAATAAIIAIAAASGGQDRLPCPAGAMCPP